MRGPGEASAAYLNVDRLSERGERGFERGFGQGRVGVDGVDDLLERGLERPSHRELVDQLRRFGPHDVDAQEKAGDLIGKGREYFEEQRNRLVGAFEAGRSAMKEEMGKVRGEG